MTSPQRLSFLGHDKPVITAIMSGKTPDILIKACQQSLADGAQGIAINLAHLDATYRNTEDLRSIIASVALPFMFFFYRDETELDDDQRQAILLDAVGAGASMIDVMGDLYDPSDLEFTQDACAIRKQMQLIDEIHRRGAEVVISSHMTCHRSKADVIAQLRAFEQRGADVVKIVTSANSEEDLVETIDTTMALGNALDKPFIHLCGGSFSRPHRFLGPKLGVAITFAVHDEQNTFGYFQPSIRAMRAVVDGIDWHINETRSHNAASAV